MADCVKTAEQRGGGRHRWCYLIALGSNVRHRRYGDPRGVVQAALQELDGPETAVKAAAPIHSSAPLGPSKRRYANGAALIGSDLAPPALLELLKAIEQKFGRRPGQRWAARVLDLDIVLWNGGRWRSPDLTVPHPAFRKRGFVLGPAVRLAPNWRDPVTGLSLRHLHARLTRRAPLPRARAW
jgi:2-amino-4-hydroxy-6-hydroxymethyldihydropteridine diphosphokinase